MSSPKHFASGIQSGSGAFDAFENSSAMSMFLFMGWRPIFPLAATQIIELF